MGLLGGLSLGLEGGIRTEKKTYDRDFTRTRRQNSDGKKPYDPPEGTSSRWNSDGKKLYGGGTSLGQEGRILTGKKTYDLPQGLCRDGILMEKRR